VIAANSRNRGRAHSLVALSLFLAAGCDWRITPEPPPRPVPAEAVVDFAELYNRNCAGCHGPDGRMGPAPPLNDTLFLAIVPDEELQMVVAAGRHGTLMPAWSPGSGGSLTEKQVKVLSEGIKKQWASKEEPKGEIPSYNPPDDKPAGDKSAGEKVFASACAGCHGEHGRGGEKAGAVNDSAFLSLLSDQALRRLIITGRNDLGMPGYGPPAGRSADFKPLTNADVGNLTALLAYWRSGSVATK
jgi:mono/diheme cytochrome c family protein